MQKYSKLLVVLPCHSLEDFPIHHRGEDAANLLAHWTALWHPALIASTGAKPDWQQADNPDIDFDDQPEEGVCLALIPTIAHSTMDSEVIPNFEAIDAVIISGDTCRTEIANQAIKSNAHAQSLTEKLDEEIVKDFHALGYAFLQIQIMTRQLRYSSNLDEAYFSETVAKTAEFATQGDHENAKSGLQKCFDILLEEKNAYYPVEPDLVDVVLTADTTLGNSLSRQLDRKHPFNLLLTGANAERLKQQKPESFEKLKQRIKLTSNEDDSDENDSDDGLEYYETRQITIIGGLQDELPEPLVSTESLINQLHTGRAAIQKLFQVEPTIFMRRRFGLSPHTPGVLEQFNFTGAIHATLDDGTFPVCSNANIRWTGNDDRSILAFGETPLDASNEGSFVGLGVKLGEAIDSAHIATIVFCHWPDKVCQSFKDIMRIGNYNSLFGSFVGLEDYFDAVYDPGYGDSFGDDEYRDPFLKQAIERETPNPISTVTKYWERFYKLKSCRGLLTQLCAKTPIHYEAVDTFKTRIDNLQSATESALNSESDTPINQLIETLTKDLTNAWSTDDSNSGEEIGTELINTTSFKRRVILNRKGQTTGSIKNEPPIILASGNKESAYWVAEVPAMGSVKISDSTLGTEDVFKNDPLVCQDLVLRNESFELKVDPKTGGILSIQLYKTRVNLLSQQLAIRIPSQRDARNQPLTKARYTKMVADQVEPHLDSKLSGTIVSSGQLLDGVEPLAKFKQSVSLSRGMLIAEVNVEIELLSELTQSRNHYVCSRMAWKDESSRVIANSQEARQDITSDWFTATNFMEVIQASDRLLMLTSGLPFHRRASRRMLDSLLVVGKETSRTFRFGFGANVPYAMAAAENWMTPAMERTTFGNDKSKNESAWLFHFNCKNILATWWEPFFDRDQGADHETADWQGVRIRLRETEGRSGTLAIRTPRPIGSAEKVNFGGDFLQSLTLGKDDPTKLEVEFGRNDYFQISIYWKK